MRWMVMLGVLALPGVAQWTSMPAGGFGRSGAGVRAPGQIVGGVSGRPSGFGSVLYPGTGGPPGSVVYGSGLPAYIPGTGVYTGNTGIYRNGGVRNQQVFYGSGRGGAIAVPYAFPVLVNNPYPVPVPVEQQQPQVPMVVINQNFVGDTPRPVVKDYSDLPESPAMREYHAPVQRNEAPAAESKPGSIQMQIAEKSVREDSMYTVVFKDGSTQKAIGYGIEGDSLVFVSERGRLTRVTLDQVDVTQTENVNRDKGLDFRIK